MTTYEIENVGTQACKALGRSIAGSAEKHLEAPFLSILLSLLQKGALQF
jgi:hypothetical protein